MSPSVETENSGTRKYQTTVLLPRCLQLSKESNLKFLNSLLGFGRAPRNFLRVLISNTRNFVSYCTQLSPTLKLNLYSEDHCIVSDFCTENQMLPSEQQNTVP